jgi:4-hydroxyphenylacetate decarboxylase small subunit
VSQDQYKHNDCRNYAAVDVVSGICHLTKKTVLADENNCDDFEKLPKCRHCQHFSKGSAEYLGTCRAQAVAAMTYPDLVGVTCDWFTWIKK